jgi:glycosyltransferase involved in cell wall biosynthesis
MKKFKFTNASIILPVMNETSSLMKTIEIIEEYCADEVKEYIIVVCSKTTEESIRICKGLREKSPDQFILHYQKLPFLGGAIRESFELARGSHVILMASDLETDPQNVKDLIRESIKNPEAIVTASRWIKGGKFEGYSKLKLALNYVFQKFFSICYKTDLTDMTYGYRIFPTRLVQSIYWEELRHPFLFETLIKPLRLGIDVIEIPSIWRARPEGESQNTFSRNFSYFNIGFRVLFYSKEKIVKQTIQ